MESLKVQNDLQGIPIDRLTPAEGLRPLNPDTRELIRFIIFGSIFFLACAAAKIFFISALVILFFSFRYLQGRFDPVDALVVVLAVVPWLGVYRYLGFSFSFDRGFVILALASLRGAYGPPRRRFLSNTLDFSLAGFLAACALTAACSFMYRTPFRILLGSLLIPFGYYLVAKNCVRRPDLLPKLYVAAVIAILAFGTLGLFEAVTKVDVLPYGEKELDDFRINGPMRMAEDYGVCLNFLLLFFFAMRSMRQESPLSSRFRRIVPLLGIVNCYFTLTRGIWLSLAAGWLVQAAKRDFRFVLRIIPVLALVLWIFFKLIMPAIASNVVQSRLNNERTINARIATYKSAVAMFEDYPVLGVGFAAFNEMWERYPDRYQKEYKEEASVSSPHNIFFCLRSETGIIGVASFAFFMFQVFRCSLRLARHAPSAAHREYGLFVLSAAMAYLVAGMGLHLIRNIDFPNEYLFIFLGILSGMIDLLGLSARHPSGARMGG